MKRTKRSRTPGQPAAYSARVRGVLGAFPPAVHEAEFCPALHGPERDAQLRGPDGGGTGVPAGMEGQRGLPVIDGPPIAVLPSSALSRIRFSSNST